MVRMMLGETRDEGKPERFALADPRESGGVEVRGCVFIGSCWPSIS